MSAVSHLWATISGQRKKSRWLRIEEQHGIGFGEAGRVGQEEGRGPFARRVVPARGPDQDVVGGALAGAVEPADEQIAIGQFDHRGGVVVPLFQGEDQFARIFGGGRGTGERQEERSYDSHGISITKNGADS